MPKVYKPRASIFEKLQNFIPSNQETVEYLTYSNGGFFIKNKEWIFDHFLTLKNYFIIYLLFIRIILFIYYFIYHQCDLEVFLVKNIWFIGLVAWDPLHFDNLLNCVLNYQLIWLNCHRWTGEIWATSHGSVRQHIIIWCIWLDLSKIHNTKI